MDGQERELAWHAAAASVGFNYRSKVGLFPGRFMVALGEKLYRQGTRPRSRRRGRAGDKKNDLRLTGRTIGFQATSPEEYGTYYVPRDTVRAGVKLTVSAPGSWTKIGQGESYASFKFT